MSLINIEVEIDTTAIENHFTELCKDKQTMLEIHNLFAKMCDPYVPFLEGPLSQTALAQVTPEYVQYGGDNVPYARYQYYGTGFNHTLDYHPQATALWDEAMLREHGEEFEFAVKDILIRRYRELYG